jgi:hypothetical protein
MRSADKESFISVYQPYDTTQAGLIRNALEQSDIVCYVNNENVSSMRFGGQGSGAASMMVMVPKSHRDKAMQIISDMGLE